MHKKGFLVISLLVALFCVTTEIQGGVPSGYYYFAKNKKKAALKTALHDYCAPMRLLDYGSGPGFTWEGFFSTDRRADSTVMDMYSSTVRKFTGFTAINGMHIEHSFPKSWWGAYPNNAYKDLFHLYPADGITNETKNNLPIGEVTGTPTYDNGVSRVGKNGFSTAYTDNCFEPANEYKGDFARSYLYIASIYENLAPLMQSPMVINNSVYPFWKPWAIDLLLKWNHDDPVSQKEKDRIEAVYAIQGNRNPFVDYPDLADYIWGKDTTSVYPFPDETEPFLVAPRRGATLDFGVILQNDSRERQIHLQGVNLTGDVQLALLKNSTSLSINSPVLTLSAASAGTDIHLTFHPTLAGQVNDTLLISGGGLTEVLRIPVKALASADFIALEPTEISPVGGTLQWIADPQATDYKLNVYQGDQKAGDLFIAAYVEGSSWNKAIELYNGTGQAVDLSAYSLQKQSNGAGSFGSTLKLTGTLNAGSTYCIVHKQAAADLIAKAQLVTDSLLQYNGNDAVILCRNGLTIDMVGKANAGADVNWGLDLTLTRKSSVTHPLSVFNANEWNTSAVDSYAMLGSHTMTVVPTPAYVLQNTMTGLTNTYAINNLSPGNNYTYSVEALHANGSSKTVNTVQLHTSVLETPQIMEASEVASDRFTANWEDTPYAGSYLLNVFSIAGQPDTTVVEAFDAVGTAGKPLPTGWTGTASGNYTTTTSSGVTPPSIALKTTGEWLQTPTYPYPVSSLTFMYRYASSSAGSSLIIDGLSGTNWIRVDSIAYKNTTKTNPLYAFSKSQAIQAIRFKYNKSGSGNMAIDDVQARYGDMDTTVVCSNQAVTGNHFTLTSLAANAHYFYQVKAILGTAVSGTSDAMAVRTLATTALKNISSSAVQLSVGRDQIILHGLSGNNRIDIYTPDGRCLKQLKSKSSEQVIPFGLHGIFIVRISGPSNIGVVKFVH